MKIVALLTFLLLTSCMKTTEEGKILSVESINLLELLEKVKEISNQLAQESLLELPPDPKAESKTDNVEEVGNKE